MSTVAPAVLAHSRKEFDDTLALLASIPNVSRVQIDVVDGKFAAPASWPYVESEALRLMRSQGFFLPHLDRIAYEVDLMCIDVDQAIDDWLALGASRLTVHARTLRAPAEALTRLKHQYGGERGTEKSAVATFGAAYEIDAPEPLIATTAEHVEYVQFMGIAHVGKQGEPFDPRVIEQVKRFHLMHPDTPIQVDGGETVAHAKQLVSAGATTFVVGSAILRAPDPAAAFAAFDAALEVDIAKGSVNRI